ncbi:polysaccharide biosynthesis tyrosine autokinase [soil metagenome]
MMDLKRYPYNEEFLELSEAGLAIANAPDYPPAPYDLSSYGEEDEGIHLREYLRRLRRHKWLILSLVTIVTTLVTVYAYQIKPWYSASAVLEVGKDNALVIKSGEITLSGDNESNTDINTKILAFSNPELYRKVADELKLSQDARIVGSFQKKPWYSIFRPNSVPDAPATQPTPNTSSAAADDAMLAMLGGYIQKNVAVEQVKNTRAIRVSYQDEDPEVAQKVANSVAKIFKDTSFENQTEKFTNSVSWLDSSTRELRSKVEIAEEALADYVRENQIYSTDNNGGKTLTTANLTQLHDQFIRAQTDRMLKKSLYEQVQAGRFEELPEAFSDPKITSLQQKLTGLESQAAQLMVDYGPANPKMKEVQNQIQVVKKQIEDSRKALEAKLKAEFERVVEDERSIGTAFEKAKAGAVNENQANIKFNILKQDVDTARSLYTDFLKNTNEAKTRVAEQNNNIKFIQEAQKPGGPVGPQRLNLILAGFAFSLGAAIGLALFIEYLDNTIKSLEDVERYVMLPTLGIIPAISGMGIGRKQIKEKRSRRQIAVGENGSQLGLELRANSVQNDLTVVLDSHSILGEAYRALRTSLLLSTAGTPPKLILVTSSQSSEGKTTTAVNTAISLAQLGARVLLIDCDLRRPAVHKRLDISSADGLTNYLASNRDIESVIQKLDIPNLWVIPAGSIPPNPAELLSSRKMKDVLEQLSKNYDHIIIDSPPVMNVTDPIILSTVVDGVIFVIKSGTTSREVIKRTRQELRSVKAKIFGVVLNNVDIRRDGYDYYSYYRYSSHYATNGDSAETN